VTRRIQKEVIAVLAAALLTAGVCSHRASAQELKNWVEPTRVIYPGEVITDDLLVEEPATESATTGLAARSQIVGKIARSTLLPRHPIQLTALENKALVVGGRTIDAFYIDGSLTIRAKVVALQDGRPGDLIQVRNVDSGKIISGMVQADGGIRMSAP
jgi:flagella basal body P-ring formation protein FlgA